MAYYDNINLEKGMYTISGKSFTDVLEELDPSGNYKNSELEGLDAFQRQLKRFDIKVSGPKSDTISKFFSTTQSAALFPEYIRRVVLTSFVENSTVSDIVANITYIDSPDYRTISSNMSDGDLTLSYVDEGATIPETTIKLNSRLVRLFKRGRTLVSSYEALKYQKIDVFSTILKQIGNYIAISTLTDCLDVIVDPTDEGEGELSYIDPVNKANPVVYEDLINIFKDLYPYKLNTILVTLDVLKKILMMEEMRDTAAGLNFHGTGDIITPLGAKVVPITVGNQLLIGMDKRYTVEMIKSGDIQIEHDKLIDRQLERTVISCTYGFSKLCFNAVKGLNFET